MTQPEKNLGLSLQLLAKLYSWIGHHAQSIPCLHCAKVLTAFNGGRITMYGQHVVKRWLKLAAPAVGRAVS